MVNNSDDEHYDCGSLLVSKVCYAAKWSMSSLWPGGGASSRGFHVTEFMTYPQGASMWLSSWRIDHILWQSWPTWVSSFGKRKGKPSQPGFCNSGTQGWAWHLWGVLWVLTEISRGMACEMTFWKCEDPKGQCVKTPKRAGVPSRSCKCKCGLIYVKVYCKGCVLCRILYCKPCVLWWVYCKGCILWNSVL